MPYGFAVDRPDTDAPVSREKDPVRWTTWALKNAPFTSVTTMDWATFLKSQLHGPIAADTWETLLYGGTLSPGQVQRLLDSDVALPVKVFNVLNWARQHGYGVRIALTGDTVDQYLANSPSASQH